MKKCKDCGKEISEKFEFCYECNKKHKTTKPDSDVANWLSKINNNLYRIIKQNDVILREKYHLKVQWSKEKKDFEEINA